MPSSVGVPIRLLHECVGHKISIELSTGELYKGLLRDVEDNMNLQLQGVLYTNIIGQINKLDSIFIRGSKIRIVILPDMLKNAPLFKRFDPKAAKIMKKNHPNVGTQFGTATAEESKEDLNNNKFNKPRGRVANQSDARAKRGRMQ
jgi:small nuclear ribonucleoprotein D3